MCSHLTLTKLENSNALAKTALFFKYGTKITQEALAFSFQEMTLLITQCKTHTIGNNRIAKVGLRSIQN